MHKKCVQNNPLLWGVTKETRQKFLIKQRAGVFGRASKWKPLESLALTHLQRQPLNVYLDAREGRKVWCVCHAHAALFPQLQRRIIASTHSHVNITKRALKRGPPSTHAHFALANTNNMYTSRSQTFRWFSLIFTP